MEALWVDFQNMGIDGVRLICNGTLKEISEKNIQLKDGLELLIWNNDEDGEGNPDNLLVEAVVKYSKIDNCWVAQFAPDNFRNESGT
jgi:hypothetical protein